MTPPDLSRLHALRAGLADTRNTLAAVRPRFEALRTRHEDGTAPRAVTAHQLFQTPPELAARMAGLADIRPGDTVLEPSAGLGRLLVPILARNPRQVVACEESPDCCKELYDRFPGVRLLQGDFLARRDIPEVGKVVMNPPFHLRADIRHALHALGFIRPGGVLVGLCLSTHHRETALHHLADHWEIIPAGTFRQSNTGVETILFRIPKH